MDFMEIDSNKGQLKHFLTSKLQSAKACTTSLQDGIGVRQETLNRLQKALNETKHSCVNLTVVSKKTLHGDYILQVDIKNDSNTDCYYNQCLLHWNSAEELQYTTTCYPKDEIDAPSQNIRSNSSAIVIIVIRRPTYNKQTTYAVNGVVTYNVEAETQVLQTVLPLITLNVHEFIDTNSSDIIRGNVLGILTSYACDTFETCMNNVQLSDLGVTKCSVDKCVFYYADCIAENVNGALIQQKSNAIIRVYTRDKEHLRSFVYYLMKTLGELHCVKDYSAVLGKPCEGKGRKQFNAMLLKEVSVRNLIGNIPQECDRVVLRKRLDLIDLEYETDRFVDALLF